MCEKDLVSIVVPVYNMGNSIEQCVDSILKQDYNDIEVILVDDGSKDDSYVRCKALAEKDNRIVVFHTENRGSGPARNYGIEHANGRYIYFPDADDYMEPHAVSCMVAAMENGKYDLVVFGFTTLSPDGQVHLAKRYEEATFDAKDVRTHYAEHVGTTKRFGIQGAPWNKFFDMHVVKEYDIKYPPLRRHQDEGFISRYMCHAQSVRFISESLYVHYANDLKKEWQKYPTDYIDAVIGLYQIRQETILTWNSEDYQTHEFISLEYINNVIKALELSFMPKMNLKGKEQKAWIVASVEKAELCNISIPRVLDRYHSAVLKYLLRGSFSKAIMLMGIKVTVEKMGMLDFVRKFI